MKPVNFPSSFFNAAVYEQPSEAINEQGNMNKTNLPLCGENNPTSNGEQRHILQAENNQNENTGSNQLSTESILQALVENSFDLAGLIDENLNYRYVSDSVNQIFNSKAGALFGFAADRLLGKNCLDLVHPDDQQRLGEQIGSLLNGNKKVHLRPYRIKDALGNWHWLESIVTNQINNPNIQGIIISAREVTKQIETEQKLKEMQLLEAMMEGEERERCRIARDLHDEIAGMIAAAKMHFSALTEKLPQVTDTREYANVLNLLHKAALQVRRTSHNLMPEIVLEGGLDAALHRYCYTISNDRLKIDYFSFGTIERFAANYELSLYRITQELINNIVKHAGASHAIVQISQRNNLLSLTIEDNGKGFQHDSDNKGTGILSVQKRVKVMNGHMEINSKPGDGTNVYLEFEI